MVITVSLGTASEALALADKLGLTAPGGDQGGSAFLENRAIELADERAREFSFFAGAARDCQFYYGTQPVEGAGRPIPECDKVHSSLVGLLTLQYICRRPDSLLANAPSGPDAECPYVTAKISHERNELTFELTQLAVSLAAFTEDESFLSSRIWVGPSGASEELYDQFKQRVALSRRERFDELVLSARRALTTAQAISLNSRNWGGSKIPILLVGTESTRTAEMAELVQQLSTRNAITWGVEFTPGSSMTENDIADSICLGEPNEGALLVDAITFSILHEKGCANQLEPVARIGREDVFLVGNADTPWELARTVASPDAQVGLGAGHAMGERAPDQIVLDLMGINPNVVVLPTGSVATSALSAGRLDATVSNPFEIKANLKSMEGISTIPLTPKGGVAYHDLHSEYVMNGDVYDAFFPNAAGEGESSFPGIANNYYVAVSKGGKVDRGKVTDALRLIMSEPEWQGFLKEHNMTDIESSVTGDEFESMKDFFRP